MKRSEIVEMLRQIDVLEVGNDGPTSVFLSGKGRKKPITFSLSSDKQFITVTMGKYIFKRRYKISREEL
ncbi:MAG: hypothetical protein K0R31_1052 [Clostridiales bacterium]|jgi:hypothetical protein|nr:hypothetical protein [Clostridiales bacterium]